MCPFDTCSQSCVTESYARHSDALFLKVLRGTDGKMMGEVSCDGFCIIERDFASCAEDMMMRDGEANVEVLERL